MRTDTVVAFTSEYSNGYRIQGNMSTQTSILVGQGHTKIGGEGREDS
jgi:hypothetical protein